LCINQGCTWFWIAFFLHSSFSDQHTIDGLPNSTAFKGFEVSINGLPFGKVTGQVSPNTTVAKNVEYGVHHIKHIHSSGTTIGLGWWQKWLEAVKLLLGEAGCVGFLCHDEDSATPHLLYKHALSDDKGLIEMLTQNIEYFKKKPMNVAKVTILLDGGYHLEKIQAALEKVYPNIMRKTRLEQAAKPKNKKQVGFVPVRKRWVIERSNAWVERCKNLVKNFEQCLAHSKAKLQLCFIQLMLRRLALP
jgi:hypothetical protein